MKKAQYIAVFTLCLFMVSLLPAEALAPQAGPVFLKQQKTVRSAVDSRAQGELTSFQNTSQGVWAVRFNERTGLPLSMLGKGNKHYRLDSPEAIARAFLKEAAPVFRSGNSFQDLKLQRVLEADKSSHVHFSQMIEGVELFQCGLSVHISPVGEVRQVNGEYVPEVTVTGAWTLTGSQALTCALKNLRCSGKTEKPEMEHVLYFDGMSAIRAWKIRMSTDQPLGAWEMVVDGISGNVLYRANHIDFLTGSGSVYDLHPLAGDVVIRDLLYLGGHPSLLKCKYVLAKNDDVPEASNQEHRFVYEPDHTHFDEVMVYFQTIVIHDYFNDLGFHDMDSRPISATVHVGDNYDNAYFHPWFYGMYFGDGNKFNDLAKEANVIHHEYTHAVTGKIVSLRGGEAGAMNEAFSDYFACTQDNDHLIGEYVCSDLPRGFLRDMTNKKHYPEDIENEVHRDGEIYGAALWDLRKALGKQVADMVIHRSRYHMRSGAKFIDGLEGLVAADLDKFNGEHEAVIRQVFGKRGISAQTSTLNELLIERKFFRLLERHR